MSKKLIIFYKGVCLETIHKELIKTDAYSKKEVDNLLKYDAGLYGKSCKNMTNDDLFELIKGTCFTFADKIGIELNFPNNENFIREL